MRLAATIQFCKFDFAFVRPRASTGADLRTEGESGRNNWHRTCACFDAHDGAGRHAEIGTDHRVLAKRCGTRAEMWDVRRCARRLSGPLREHHSPGGRLTAPHVPILGTGRRLWAPCRAHLLKMGTSPICPTRAAPYCAARKAMSRSTGSQSIPTRVLTLANILRGEGVSEKNPVLPDDALRYRGVGPKTLPYLEELGLVRLDDFADLPTKIGNLLRRLGFKSRDEVVTAILTDSFILDRTDVYYRLSADERFSHIRGCGAHTFHQIRAWAGFDAPAPSDDDPEA